MDITTDVTTDFPTDITTDVTTDFTTDFSTDITTDVTTDFTTDFPTDFIISAEKRRTTIPLWVKKEICLMKVASPKLSGTDISKELAESISFNINRKRVNDILQEKERWLAVSDEDITSVTRSRLSIQPAKNVEHEDALFSWIQGVQGENVMVTNRMMQKQAKLLGDQMGITDLGYSNGWLQRFKARRGLVNQRPYDYSYLYKQGTSPRTRPGPSKPAGSLNVKPIKRQSASSQKTSPNGGSSTSPASTSSVDSKMGTSQVPKKAAPAIERRRPSGQFQRAEQQTQRKSYPKRGDAAEMKADPTVTPPQSGSAQSTPKGPGIRTRLSTGSIHMNGTTTVSTAKEKAEMDQLMRQISKSLLGYDIEVHVASTEKSGTPRSTPGSGKKRSSSVVSGLGIEDLPVDHPPPKKRKIGRNDGSGEDNRNDYFCWMCHKEGTLVCCELCPRVYHIKCLGLTGELPQDWVCPECEKIMQAECVDTRSKSMEMLSLDQLCILLKYALDRMKHSGSEPFIKAVDPAHVPRYSDYIFNPMDMTTLEKNIKTKQYGCTEALLSDAKWILHNCIIYNGTHHSLTNSAKMIIKICKHETNEIELCPDCYLNSCIRKTEEWFSEPCRVPHTLVWAKLKGYPFWPAKALREVDGQVDVRFFGAHDRSWVSVSQCFMLSRNIPTTLQKGKKNAGLSGAIKELQIHINKVRERFGNFEYAPFRTPYDKTDSYKPITQKPGPSSSMLTSSSFYSQKSGQNQSKKSMVAKTASALKSKYNMMSSVKKIDASPRKVRTNRMRVMEDNDKLASNRKSDCSGDAPLDEEQDIEENDSKTSEDKLEQATKQDNIDINSALKTPTTSINKPESKSEGEKVSDNNVENMTAKTSFPSSSIVDRLAKKIQALNEETTTEESGNSENKIDTEVSEKDKGLESRVIEQFATDKLKTETPNVESETVNNELENSKQLAVDSEIEEKKTEMKEENDTEKTELKEEKDNEKCECDPSTENSSKDNKVEKTRSIQTETKTSCEPEEESDKPNVEQSANIEQIASGKADAQTNPEGSPNKSPNIHHEVMGKEAVAKETYKQKLISTIMSCKAKLGMEVSDKEVTAVGENNEGDDIDGGSINNTDSDEEDDDEQMDTGDTKEESDDSDSSDDLEMEVEEIGSDDDAEEDYESESSHDECAKGSSTVPELPLDSLKTPATETDKGESANDDSKVTVSEKVSPDNEREASESKQSATEENATQQKTPTSDSATAIAKEAVLQEKQADTMKSRTSDESTVSDQSVKTIEPDLTVETTENAVEKSPKQDKSGVVINEQTIKDSVKQIQTKSSPEKASSFLGNKNNTDAIEDGSKKSFKSTESIDEMGTNKDMFENDTIEEDSDIDRLVIDLDSENNSSPKATKFCVRGGEVKNGSDFKKCVSPLVSEKTIKQTVNKEKPTPNTAAEKKVYIIHDNKSTPAIETLAKISPVAKKSDPKETLSEKSESRQPDIENEQSAMEIEDLASSYGAGSLSSVQSLPETAVSRAGSEAGSFTTATPANRLAEKFSKQLMMTIQKTLDEMCVEVLQERVPEPSNSELQVQLQQARNDYSTQLSELKHNFKLTVWEMKGSWAAEKDQLTRNLERKHKAEMEKTVAEVKKKQWCSQCGKEAIFYCCWNTSYCDYPCQQNHWPQHMHTCLQTNKDKPGAVTPISTASSSQPAAINLVSSSGIVTCGPSSACAVSSSSGSSPQGNHHIRQRLQDTISAALQREEEKRGEIRTGPSPKFVSMPTPMNALPNTRQSTPVSFGSSLLFPSNIASNNQMVPHSRPGMIQQIPRNMLLNPPMRMSVQTSRPVNNMLLPQPMIQQQAMYPVQLQHHQQQQQQQQHMGGAILFQNPQPNLMGYNMRPPF